MEKIISTMEDGLLKEDHALFKMLMNNAPSWWQPIKEDKDLYIEVRKGNVIDIYFQGGRMAEVKIENKRLIVTAHPKYLGHTDEDDEKYYKRGKKDGKTVYTPIYQDCEGWLTNRREELKANIRRYYSSAEDGENTPEKFIQGELIINGRDKYLDSEFAHRHYEGDRKTIRIDLIKIEKGKIVFEELKRICDSRLRTTDGKPEIIEQMNNYREFVRKNKTALTKYYRTLYLIKKNLGLPVPQIVDVNKLEVDLEPQLLIALNYKKMTVARKKRIEDIETVLTENNIQYKTILSLSMKITIHRGTDQIGGCVTEYEYNGWHLFVDYGEELPGSPKTGDLQIEGLTKGDLSQSALLITHYHGDHIGCINKIPQEVPIYIGKVGREIQLVLSEHLSSVDDLHKDIIARLQETKTFKAGETFEIGPFKIMPVTIDHSAFDAYAFKIEADCVSVFHTGDFRTHGFRSSNLARAIERYVGRVDYVVCEGTNVSRPDATSKSERQLQKEFENEFRQNKGSVIYVSSTNIDRIFALYHAAVRTGRKFIVDRYQKQIMDVVVKQEHIWNKSKLYQYGEEEPMELKYEYGSGEFLLTDKFKYLLDKVGYVLIARANPRFDNLVSRFPGDKKKYLSMWEGYLKKDLEAYNEKLAASLSDEYTLMHTSGHCDMKSMRELFRMLQPKGIIPIHTNNPEAFAKLFCDEGPIIRLYDGESYTFCDKCLTKFEHQYEDTPSV